MHMQIKGSKPYIKLNLFHLQFALKKSEAFPLIRYLLGNNLGKDKTGR